MIHFCFYNCSKRRLAQKYFGVNDPDFYEWETHIFFDDCMAKPVKGKKDNVNGYVKDLIGAVDDYGKQWYGKNGMAIPELTKYVTPYGGEKSIKNT